jgi:hypothetical protein
MSASVSSEHRQLEDMHILYNRVPRLDRWEIHLKFLKRDDREAFHHHFFKREIELGSDFEVDGTAVRICPAANPEGESAKVLDESLSRLFRACVDFFGWEELNRIQKKASHPLVFPVVSECKTPRRGADSIPFLETK